MGCASLLQSQCVMSAHSNVLSKNSCLVRYGTCDLSPDTANTATDQPTHYPTVQLPTLNRSAGTLAEPRVDRPQNLRRRGVVVVSSYLREKNFRSLVGQRRQDIHWISPPTLPPQNTEIRIQGSWCVDVFRHFIIGTLGGGGSDSSQ